MSYAEESNVISYRKGNQDERKNYKLHSSQKNNNTDTALSKQKKWTRWEVSKYPYFQFPKEKKNSTSKL